LQTGKGKRLRNDGQSSRRLASKWSDMNPATRGRLHNRKRTCESSRLTRSITGGTGKLAGIQGKLRASGSAIPKSGFNEEQVYIEYPGRLTAARLTADFVVAISCGRMFSGENLGLCAEALPDFRHPGKA
jgi:hypothetical protein